MARSRAAKSPGRCSRRSCRGAAGACRSCGLAGTRDAQPSRQAEGSEHDQADAEHGREQIAEGGTANVGRSVARKGRGPHGGEALQALAGLARAAPAGAKRRRSGRARRGRRSRRRPIRPMPSPRRECQAASASSALRAPARAAAERLADARRLFDRASTLPGGGTAAGAGSDFCRNATTPAETNSSARPATVRWPIIIAGNRDAQRIRAVERRARGIAIEQRLNAEFDGRAERREIDGHVARPARRRPRAARDIKRRARRPPRDRPRRPPATRPPPC